jgi:nucleoporin NUP159
MADSPFATPPTNRSKMSLSELNRRALTPEVDVTPIASKGYGLDYTLEGSPGPGIELARISDFVDDNIDSLRETARRRKEVAMGLKKALIARGLKSTTVR